MINKHFISKKVMLYYFKSNRTMEKLIKLNAKIVCILYMVVDIIYAGMGMGVPIFCIMLGFPLGWYIVKRISESTEDSHLMFYKILKLSLLASAFTFLLMVVIWGRTIPMLFDPMSDFKNFGHPFILYEPKISFIGWLILMIFISPFLQLLATVFASFITLMKSGVKNSSGE
jgi:prolipoprotein diacylglyceryltransferase